MVAALEINLTHVLYAWILVVAMLVAAILFLPPLIVPAKIDEPKRREVKKAEWGGAGDRPKTRKTTNTNLHLI